MTLSRIASRFALGALAAGAAITLAAPLLPFEQAAQAGGPKEETTISISTSKDEAATVLKLEPMKVGETKTLTSESGQPVTVTRTEDGYTIRTGEKEFTVKTHVDGDGPHVLLPGGKEVVVMKGHACGDDDATMVFSGDGEKKVVVKKHAFAYTAGEGAEKPSAAEVLKQAAPNSLESLDSRTRGAVEQVFQEMLESGAVFAPGAMPMTWVGKDDGDGEKVKVMVIRKKDETK